MTAWGISDVLVVGNKILTDGQRFLDEIIVNEVFDDSFLGGFFCLGKTSFPSPYELGKGLLSNDAEIVVVYEKSLVHFA